MIAKLPNKLMYAIIELAPLVDMWVVLKGRDDQSQFQHAKCCTISRDDVGQFEWRLHM